MAKLTFIKAPLAAAVASAIFTIGASAAPLTGDFSVSGSFLPMADGMSLSDLLNANAIDFTDPAHASTPTPGVDGVTTVTGATGDFTTLLPIGTAGTVHDFAFNGAGFLPSFPAPPVFAFEQFGSGVSVDLLSVALIRQTESFLDLRGTTTIHADQYAPTSGSFSFNGVAGRAGNFSFVAIDPPAPIPEPASLALFGIALAGLGLMRFKRQS